MKMVANHLHLSVGWNDVHMTRLDPNALSHFHHWNFRVAGQQFWQCAAMLRGEMLNENNGEIGVLRQSFEHLAKRVEATRRGTHTDDDERVGMTTRGTGSFARHLKRGIFKLVRRLAARCGRRAFVFGYRARA